MLVAVFFGWGKKAKLTISCPLCEQSNSAESSVCIRCGYKLGQSNSLQQDDSLQKQASDLFSALMEEVEDESQEPPMVDWSQTTFTMDDVTIDVAQYDDSEGVELSSKPSFATQYDEMPDDAKKILPSKIDSEIKADTSSNLDTVDADENGHEDFGGDGAISEKTPEETAEEGQQKDLATSEVEEVWEEEPTQTEPRQSPPSEESIDSHGIEHDDDFHLEYLPMVEAVADDDLPMVEAVADDDLPMVEAVLAEEGNNKEVDTNDIDTDPWPEMDEDELLSLTNAELRSMLSGLNAPTNGNKKELVSRLVEFQKEGPPSRMEEDATPADGSEDLLKEEISSGPESGSDMQNEEGLPPSIHANIGLDFEASVDSEMKEVNLTIEPHSVDYSGEVTEDEVRVSFWPWPQEMPWTERDIAVKLKQAMEEAKARKLDRARDLLDETGPHLGERTRLLFPVCRLLQALGRGDKVKDIIADAEQAYPADPAVSDARYRLGV